MDQGVAAASILKTMDAALVMLTRVAGVPSDDRARVLLLAIAGQESAWVHRVQVGGPAHSFWQFEEGGGVLGVLTHRATRDKIKAVCAALEVPCTTEEVYAMMALPEHDDLSSCMARLLLWTDPRPLPAVGDRATSWEYYMRLWRPGLPRPETWDNRYATAQALVV